MSDCTAEEEAQAAGGGGGRCLADSQSHLLDRCLHALRHAQNDSQTLAALLLITQLCPAGQLDKVTMRRVFEAVGPDLPARLLVTAVRDADGSGLPPQELLSLGTALLAALSSDPDMASRPQLLATVPLLLGLLADGLPSKLQDRGDPAGGKGEGMGRSLDADRSANQEAPWLDEAMAADCFLVLTAVCALPRGPELLLNRGAVPALCRATEQSRFHQRALCMLGCLLSGNTKEKAWSRHPAELLTLLRQLTRDLCRAPDLTRFQTFTQLARFLPLPGAASQSGELREAVSGIWVALRPTLQAKLTPRQIGPVLVLAACLLDLCGWEPAGPPKFCCLLVNRACVEVRMGLEEPPGSDLSPELQNTLTGCYRIMEAAMEQACTAGDAAVATPPLSLQQSRQVLGVLQEAFSAVMFYLQQADPGCVSDPFLFATFRVLCSWLAEETSCLKEEVIRLLPFLIGYARRHQKEEPPELSLSDWMERVSVSEEGGSWTGRGALGYLLPALTHLSAEDASRKVLLSLDAPALLVDFLTRTWAAWRGRGGSAMTRDPSMETACSALLNLTVTEPESVRKDPCFRTLEAHLSEALPVLVNKPRLLVLAANYCTLGLMIGRLEAATGDSPDAAQRRFFSAALRFLHSGLRYGSGSGSDPVQADAGREDSWEEAAELWRLSLQALGGCVRVQPWLAGLIRDEGWLRRVVGVLAESGAARPGQEVLEEALCAVAERCPDGRREIREAMNSGGGGALRAMTSLRKLVGV